MYHFWAQKWFIYLKQNFWKMIDIVLIYLLEPFIVQNSKNILPADPDNFFRKPVNVPCFFDSCLSTCLNTEISLAKSNFWL